MAAQSIPCLMACFHQECSKARSVAITVAEARAAAPAPKKLEPAAVPVERAPKVRKAAAVSNAKPDVKPVSNGAARIARWRSKQDPEVRKQQNRDAVQRCRAKKKANS